LTQPEPVAVLGLDTNAVAQASSSGGKNGVPGVPFFPGHDGGAWAPGPSLTVASWPTGHFAENVAVAGDGTVFVSLHSHHRIDRYRPATGELDVFCELPTPAAGLAFDAGGTLWVTGGELGQAPGYVWRVHPDGTAREWLQIPDALFLNGCAVLPGLQTLLVAESLTGRVLAVDQRVPEWSVWLEDGFLRPEHEQMPGANGIKAHRGWVWVSVTDRDTLLRVPVGPDGRAGQPEMVAEGLRADDFAFGESGAMYITTHVAQSVLRLDADGTRTTIAGPAEGAVGSTACAFGRTPEDRQALYVTTNGGLSLPYEGKLQDAKLLRLEVGERGQPLPGN
jgi:sugar lactone lactonase YvrE